MNLVRGPTGPAGLQHHGWSGRRSSRTIASRRVRDAVHAMAPTTPQTRVPQVAPAPAKSGILLDDPKITIVAPVRAPKTAPMPPHSATVRAADLARRHVSLGKPFRSPGRGPISNGGIFQRNPPTNIEDKKMIALADGKCSVKMPISVRKQPAIRATFL